MFVYQVSKLSQAGAGEGFCRIGGWTFGGDCSKWSPFGNDRACAAAIGAPIGPWGPAENNSSAIGVEDGHGF